MINIFYWSRTVQHALRAVSLSVASPRGQRTKALRCGLSTPIEASLWAAMAASTFTKTLPSSQLCNSHNRITFKVFSERALTADRTLKPSPDCSGYAFEAQVSEAQPRHLSGKRDPKFMRAKLLRFKKKCPNFSFRLANKLCKIATCFLFALLFLSNVALAQEFNYHEKCKATYNEIFKLKIPYARQIIAEQKVGEPKNLAWLLLESYCDFLTSFIREDYEEFEQMEIEFDARLKAIDALPNDDPWKRYAKAEIHMHKAFARAKYEEYISTIWDLRKGFKLLEENVRRFPEFQPNNKSLGFFHAVIGTIPGKYRFGAKLLGFSGNVEQGMQEIKDYMVFAKAENTFFDEAQLLNIFFLIYLDKQHEKAWKIVQEELQPRENLFHNFMYTEIAYKAGEADIAINTIENRPKGPEYVEYYFMDFFEGIVKMTRLDEDAGESIQKFIDNFSGRHYLKEAWQRLALCNLLKGDTALYLQQLANCKTKGAALMDADKQAQKDAELNVIPNIGLLKARFLNDGGYTERAVAVLQAMDTSKLSQNHKIEWLYRNGSVLENDNSIDEAVSFYKASIKTSPNNELYFAAKACLHLGHFYIKNKQLALAEKYYKMVANFDKHPFKDSFEQQAKAGLSRVKGFN